MIKILEKIMLSDKDYEYLTKGIALGVGIGVLVGSIIGNITLAFAAGGVVGILSAFAYSIYKRKKSREEKDESKYTV